MIQIISLVILIIFKEEITRILYKFLQKEGKLKPFYMAIIFLSYKSNKYIKK